MIEQDFFSDLRRFLALEYREQSIYPAQTHVMRALESVDFDRVRVVILGQDPYHGANQAIGLSFAVPNDFFPKPPSLINIFKELSADLGVAVSRDQSDLTGWVEQGVLLLNSVLTVRHGQAFSHQKKGWEIFTDQVIKSLNSRKDPVVFILWGASAQKKRALISAKHHFVIESVHPSPLSAYRGFFGSKPFSKVNHILVDELKQEPIDWLHLSSECANNRLKRVSF